MISAERTSSSANPLDNGARLRRRGEYGIDGNITLAVVMTAATVALLTAAAVLARIGFTGAAAASALVAALPLTVLGYYLHTTRRGKFLVWAEILDNLKLRGDERVLDAGCGRGAVLTMVAKRLPRGRVVGIDIWSKRDQSGNSAEAAEDNLAAEGVRERCELMTGDMRSMPFPDASFDLIVSSLAIHNIPGSAGRSRAIDEIARVLAPGARVAIADLACTGSYAQRLRALGFIGVKLRRLGWRFWWGPRFPATTLVTGTRARSEAVAVTG
jgi:arsenite methyltransferase